jgi:hypothetical protein
MLVSVQQRYDYTFYCSSCAPFLFVASSLTGHSLLVRPSPGDLRSQHIRWALATAPGAWRKCIGLSTRRVFLIEGSMPPATRAHPCRAVAAGTPRRRAFLKMPQIDQGRTRVRPCQSNTFCKLSKLTTVRIEWLGALAPWPALMYNPNQLSLRRLCGRVSCRVTVEMLKMIINFNAASMASMVMPMCDSALPHCDVLCQSSPRAIQ